MALNIDQLIGAIVGAVKPVLLKDWKDAEPFAKTEAVKMAHTLANIADLYASGQINDAQAQALLDMQKQASQAVLTAIEGIGVIAAQNAINAALGAVRAAVNDVLGIKLV
jgi:hypothetical protein